MPAAALKPSEAPETEPAFNARFSATGALRRRIGKRGRAHVDRWLPFLVLCRASETSDGLARRVAINSPSYCLWRPGEDHDAAAAIAAVAGRLAKHCGRLLVITLDDPPPLRGAEDRPRLPRFVARIHGGEDAAGVRAREALKKAMAAVEVDLRRCEIEGAAAAGGLPDSVEAALAGIPSVERIGLTLPDIHRRDGGGIYPALAHDLAVASGDALLRAACAFLDDGDGRAPVHYRQLGRSAYLAAARKIDRKLDAIATSFDFLLSISPIDTARAREQFFSDQAEKCPDFQYRPLSVDPDLAKRTLFAIDLEAMEDPLLERLLSEKRRELDAQLTMLATRNTPAFRPASMMLYGSVDPPLLADALSLLGSTATDPPRGKSVGADAIAAAAHDLVDRYRAADPAFAAEIELRDDVAGLMVSGPKLMIATDAVMPARRLEALLAHEVSVHLLTYFNGASQGLGIFRTGLAGYEGVQEGLGVFAEWAVGGLTRTRLRLLAGRVVAVNAMQGGATFVDVWRILAHDHGFTRGGAFGITARVFRSGGLAKDAIYLRGFREVLDLVAAGDSLDLFWLGKIAPDHTSAIEELLRRGLVRRPRFVPLFLETETARSHIEKLKKGGALTDLLNGG